MSAEPSMEDILSSIKRIIAEEGDAAVSTRPARRSARPTSVRERSVDPGDVLELSVPVVDDHHVVPPSAAELPAIDAGDDGDDDQAEPILSETAAEASRGALDSLSRLVVKPVAPAAAPPPAAETLEGMVREMLRPMLREWLDARLPGMVEEMVAKEIARITQGR